MFIHVGKPMFPFTSLLFLGKLMQYTQKKKVTPFQQNIFGAASVAVGRGCKTYMPKHICGLAFQRRNKGFLHL